MKLLVRALLPSALGVLACGLLAHFSPHLANFLFGHAAETTAEKIVLLSLIVLPFGVATYATYRMSMPDIRTITDLEGRLHLE